MSPARGKHDLSNDRWEFAQYPDITGALDAARDKMLVCDDTDEVVYKGTLRDVFRALGGTTFPLSPSDGDAFFRTDLGEWFSYDSANSVWLGPEQHSEFGKGGTGYNNQYLEFGGDAISSAARGFFAPYDLAITGITASWSTSITSGTFRVRRDGTDTFSADVATYALSGTTLARTGGYAAFDKNATLSVYLDTLSSGINHPHAVVFWRRRAT